MNLSCVHGKSLFSGLLIIKHTINACATVSQMTYQNTDDFYTVTKQLEARMNNSHGHKGKKIFKVMNCNDHYT